jgi:hypothetical protein
MLIPYPRSVNVYDRFIPGPDAVFEPGSLYMSVNCMGFHCFSRGSVHIGSADPLASPVIDFNMFSNEVDIDLLIAGFNLTKRMITTEPLASLVDSVISPSPECRTPEQIKDFVRQAAGTSYHPIATVGMLPKVDGGCVSERLKIYGTENLRVVRCLLMKMKFPQSNSLFSGRLTHRLFLSISQLICKLRCMPLLKRCAVSL